MMFPLRAPAFFGACLALVATTQGQSEFQTYSAGLPALGYAGSIVDLSADGRSILGIDTLPSDTSYVITGGSTTFLPTGPYANAPGRGISGDGRVVVGSGDFPPSTAIYWVNGSGPFDLPGPAGANESGATAVNGDGSVIAGRATIGQDAVAVRWVDNVPEVIDPPLGFPFVSFSDVSLDGTHMVGELSSFPSFPVARAVRWSADTGYTLLDFPAGSVRTFARGQSADGQLTVGTRWISASGRRAVAWDAAGTLVELHDPAWVNSWGVDVDAAGSRALLRVQLASTFATYLYDLSTGEAQPLVDVLAQTGGPALPLEEVEFPQAMSADGATMIGNRFGQPSDPDYLLWGARINSFGAKVCGPAQRSSVGVGASLLGSGSVSLSSPSAQLTATLLPPGEFGLFLASQTLDPVVFMGSQVVLCVGGDIGRFNGPGQVAASGPDGVLNLTLDLASLPQPSGSVAAMAGETWYFQAWFRDQNPLPTSNFTDALSVMFTQ